MEQMIGELVKVLIASCYDTRLHRNLTAQPQGQRKERGVPKWCSPLLLQHLRYECELIVCLVEVRKPDDLCEVLTLEVVVRQSLFDMLVLASHVDVAYIYYVCGLLLVTLIKVLKLL